MGYDTYDFTESMRIAGVELGEVTEVLQAWGDVDAEGACCEQCGGEWTGGFVFRMRDGRIGKVEGWCDYTGWGCQDGSSVEWLDVEPPLIAGADIQPSDLNGEHLADLAGRDREVV